MGLSGSLQSHSLAEVFQRLHDEQATGVLRITGIATGVDVVVGDGAVIDLRRRHHDRTVTVLERLRAMGVTMPEQAQSSDDWSPTRSATVSHLLAAGQLDPERTAEALRHHIFDELCDCFRLAAGSYQFVDAGAGDRHAEHLLSQASGLGVRIEIPELLADARERLDEWEAISEDLPAADAVLEEVPGRDTALRERFGDFPESSVIALVDGVRTVGEIRAATSMAQILVDSVLYDALCENLLRPLAIGEMVERASLLDDHDQPEAAARLLCSALALGGEDAATARALAGIVGRIRERTVLAAAHAALARQALAEERHEDAFHAAHTAVEHAPRHTEHRQLLIRCQLAVGDRSGAVAGLHALAEDQLAAGAGQAGRATLQQILELAPDDEVARRALAQAAQSADWTGTGETAGVVCLACGAVDRAGSERCSACGESLQVTCLNCGRAAALSDRTCLFCGADPHRSPRGRRGGGGPSTTTIIRRAEEGGARGVVDVLEDLVQRAHAAEAEERFADAITLWREIQAHHEGDREVQRHLRELEHLVHDQTVETAIERGNQLRRQRRHWRAVRAYTSALRAMGADDPRRHRLRSLHQGTRRAAMVTTAIYALALGALGGVGWMVAEPLYRERQLHADLASVRAEIEAAAAAEDPQRLLDLREDVADLAARATANDDRGEKAVAQVAEALRSFRQQAWIRSLAELETAVAAADWDRARERIAAHQRLFGDLPPMGSRFDELVAAVAARVAERDALPARRAAIAAARDADRLREALDLATAVAESPAASAEDRALAAQLAAERAQVVAALEAASALAASDLAAARASLVPVATAATAWDLADDHAQRLAAVERALAAARSAFAALGEEPELAELRAFLADHPAAPEVERVRRRAELLAARVAEQSAERERLLAHWRAARAADDHAAAVAALAELERRFPAASAAAELTRPLVLTGLPPTASVHYQGAEVARADAAGRLVWWHAPDLRGRAQVRAPGFESAEVTLGTAAWQHVLSLPRSLAWSWPGEAAALSLRADGEGFLVVVGGELIALDAAGAARWRQRVADEGSGDVRQPPAWSRVHVAPEQGVLIAPAAGGLRLVDPADGSLAGDQAGPPLRGPGVLYDNDLLGRQLRVAAIDHRLWHGTWGGDWAPVAGLDRCIDGPVVVSAGLERALVVATEAGLVAVDDTTGERLWSHELSAIDIRLLGRLADGALVVLLDGSRLAVVDLALAGASRRWQRAVADSLRGVPVVAGDHIALVTAAGYARWSASDGTPVATIAAPRPPVLGCALADGGLVLALAAVDQPGWELHCLDATGALRWRRHLPAQPLHLIAAHSTVVVAMDDGMLWGLAP